MQRSAPMQKKDEQSTLETTDPVRRDGRVGEPIEVANPDHIPILGIDISMTRPGSSIMDIWQ